MNNLEKMGVMEFWQQVLQEIEGGGI